MGRAVACEPSVIIDDDLRRFVGHADSFVPYVATYAFKSSDIIRLGSGLEFRIQPTPLGLDIPLVHPESAFQVIKALATSRAGLHEVAFGQIKYVTKSRNEFVRDLDKATVVLKAIWHSVRILGLSTSP